MLKPHVATGNHRLGRLFVALSVLPGAAAGLAQSGVKIEPGLEVRLYDIGQGVAALPELARGEKPNAVKVVPTLDLKSEGDFEGLKDSFMSEAVGFIEAAEEGTYGFRLMSDDGSKLWIDERLVIDNDGLHGDAPKDGEAELSRGRHALRILHFENSGGERLTLQWKPPAGQQFDLVPPDHLSHDASATPTTASGVKRIIPPLRRGRPGDGTPVKGMHPGYELTADKQMKPFFSNRLSRIDPRFVAVPSVYPGGPGSDEAFFPDPGAIWMPARAARPVAFVGGPFADQSLVVIPCEGIARVAPELIGGRYQGAVLWFSSDQGVWRVIGDKEGQLVTWTEPDGEGNAVESRWAPKAGMPFEVLTVSAMTNGLQVDFTKPLDPRVGWEADSYYVEQWPFDAENAPYRDGIRYAVKSASVSPDRRKVFLEIDSLKPSHVVYLRLLPPCLSESGELPWSTEAWYTLNVIPEDRMGEVRQPPPSEPQNFLTEEERAGGWKLLFDGKTTAGWRGFQKDHMPDGWSVIDGALVRTGGGGDIVTEEEFDNFELQLEWRVGPAGNSGIFFHVSEEPKYKYVWQTGPEMQVLDNAEHVDGRNPKTSAGSNYALHAPPRDVTQPVGLYNQVRIVVDGPHVEHWLNGEKVVEYELWSQEWEKQVAGSKFASMPDYGREKTGRIALQDHGDKVWFRNIKIRRLDKR